MGSIGQSKTYFGVEYGWASDIHSVTDNGDYLLPLPTKTAPVGFVVTQDMGNSLFFEIGLTMKYYYKGTGFKSDPVYTLANVEPSWIFPLRFGRSIKILKDKFRFTPSLGYSFGVNPPINEDGYQGTAVSKSVSIDFSYTENPDIASYFSMIQIGAGLDFKIFKHLKLTFGGSYYKGLNTIQQLNVNYTINKMAPFSGTDVNNGSYWNIYSRLSFPISSLWNNN